jgi:transcriptional regulator with XRE-family HTH domain
VSKTLKSAQSTLATNVKQFRKRTGITQEELAFKAGIDRTYASQIERAIANPSLGIICQIADAINCSPAELISKVQLQTKKLSTN